MHLLRSQRNQLYDLIIKNELSPSQFEFKKVDSTSHFEQTNDALFYKGENYFFIFDSSANDVSQHYAIFSPAFDSIKGRAFTKSWKVQLVAFQEWLLYVKREISSPDKWSRLEQELQSLNINFEKDTNGFTISEYQELVEKVNLLQNRITEIGLSAEQSGIINAKLDYLLEMAKSMSKFDWKSLFIGTMLSIPIQLGVTPENVNLLWVLIKGIFEQYLLN